MHTQKLLSLGLLLLLMACTSNTPVQEEPDVESLRKQVKPTEVRTLAVILKSVASSVSVRY